MFKLDKQHAFIRSAGLPPLPVLLVTILLMVGLSLAQTTQSNGRGVVRLRVRVKEGEATKGLARKRFFLIRGSLEQNRRWIQLTEQQTITSRDCYFRTAGASEQFIKWLDANDCESVYCREIKVEDVDAVPEFQKAVEAGMAEFQNRDVARKWLSVNLPSQLRDGFYQSNQQRLQQFLRDAETTSGFPVLSVMTDRNGTAYFTDLEPGTYVLSNLLPTQISTSVVKWNCELQVKPGDISAEKPFLISNRKDRNVKCVAVERPLPVCATTAAR